MQTNDREPGVPKGLINKAEISLDKRDHNEYKNIDIGSNKLNKI